MNPTIFKENRIRILVFSPLKRLIGIFHSCNAAASALGVSTLCIHDACAGELISCKKLYFRQLYEDKIEIDMLEDLGDLRLEDYDKLMGLERQYYPNKKMSRSSLRLKYNTQNKTNESKTIVKKRSTSTKSN